MTSLRAPAAGLLALALLAPALAAGPAGAVSPQASQDPARSLGSARAQAAELRAQVEDLSARLTATTTAYESARSRLGVVSAERVGARRDLEAARSAEDHERAALRSRVRSLYSGAGSLAVVAGLLRGADPLDLATRATVVGTVVRADRQALVAAERARAAAERAASAAATAAVEELAADAEVAVEAARLEALLAEQQRLLAGVDDEVARLLQEEAARERARERLTAAAPAADAAEVLPGGPGRLPGSGYGGSSGDAARAYSPASTAGMACPVGPVNSFSDTWLAARSGGRRHQGTDVFAPYGSTAFAVVDGVVDKVGNGGLGGITLWIRSDSGDRFYYAHNAANLVALGDRVTAGQPVARVGKTGNAATTPPHVHFEAHPGGGRAANPYRVLRALCG